MKVTSSMFRKGVIVISLLVLSLFVSAPSFAAPVQGKKVLYYVDGVLGFDCMNAALSNLAAGGLTNNTKATSQADFESKVAAGGWDLVILFLQNFNHNGIYSYPQFTNYIIHGGKGILTDWFRDMTLGKIFRVLYTGNTNSDQLIIPNLACGTIPSVPLTNSGWSIAFSMGMIDIYGDVVEGMFVNNQRSIVSYNRTTIVNGFLCDTFAVAQRGQGIELYESEIIFLLFNDYCLTMLPD